MCAESASSGTSGLTTPTEPMLNWEGEEEMQRLLDLLPDVVPQDMTSTSALNASADDFATVLDLGLPGWDLCPPAVPAF